VSPNWPRFMATYDRDSLRVAKSQLFLPAIARNSSRMARCAGVIVSPERMASIPSLIPRNAPSMATSSLGFHRNRILDSCLPTIRLLKLIVMPLIDKVSVICVKMNSSLIWVPPDLA
jgi:hypothetical protein